MGSGTEDVAALWFSVMLVALVAVCALASLVIKYRRERDKFKRYFHDKCEFIRLLVTQDMVDYRLRQLSWAFKNAADQQAVALRDRTIDEVATEKAIATVERTKAAFWTAHRLAKEDGYETKPSIKDYFPQKREEVPAN